MMPTHLPYMFRIPPSIRNSAARQHDSQIQVVNIDARHISDSTVLFGFHVYVLVFYCMAETSIGYHVLFPWLPHHQEPPPSFTLVASLLFRNVWEAGELSSATNPETSEPGREVLPTS